MRSSLTLGRIGGIQVGVNWSWLVVFALIVWTLYSAIFPERNPGLGNGTYAALAIVTAILFFVSLLLHEYGHAIVARREGMEIEGITLWLFGGVARFKGQFPSAGAEFRIAIAGPLVSLVIGVVSLGAAWLLPLPEVVDAVAAWLGSINITLLLFNLLPALPLDGGRVLRSILWGAKHDFAAATHLAANVGRAFGYLFIGSGLFLLIFQGSFSGAWMAFIGWFLLEAASAEDRYSMTRAALGGLRVRDLMTENPATARPDETLGTFLDETLSTRRHTTYPVVEEARAVGLLPFSCVVAVPRSEWDTRTVRDCMVPLDEVPVFAPEIEAIDAAAELSEQDARRGLVVENGRLAGLLSLADVARALETRARQQQRKAA